MLFIYLKCNGHAQNGAMSEGPSAPMLRGVLFKQVVLALVLKSMHYPHPSAAGINVLFMTIIELCRLKKEDDDDEKPDETTVFCNSGFSV